MLQGPEAPVRVLPWTVYEAWIVPALERLIARGLIANWGITGIGYPDCILDALAMSSPTAVQCIANVLDSPGSLKFYEESARPREIISKAVSRNVGVLGIRAVQAGALTDAIDRPLPEDHPETRDYRRAAPFRELARHLGESAASLAHRYALSMPGVDAVVLGVKNRNELDECLRSEAAGPLSEELITRIDRSVRRLI
jgi:aryl-alcohol dehydrogenase-like predicted oxidoreductase